jgi:hypothetical protein
MTIKFTSNYGSFTNGQIITLSDQDELNFVQIGVAGYYNSVDSTVTSTTYPSGDIVLVAGGVTVYPITVRSVGVFAPVEADGITAVSVLNQTITGSMTGQVLKFSNFLYNDFDDSALNTAGSIVVPAGVTKAWVFGSVAFSPDPTVATGRRWVRLLLNGSSHLGNVGKMSAGTIMPTVCQVNTGGWFSVLPGYTLNMSAIQDSGASIVLNSGNVTNNGASTWLRAYFR